MPGKWQTVCFWFREMQKWKAINDEMAFDKTQVAIKNNRWF